MDSGLSVLFFGRRSVLSLQVLEAVAKNYRVAGVVESHFINFEPERGLRRWLRPVPARADIERFARRNALPYFLLTPDRIEALITFIRTTKPDIGVISGLAQLLPPKILSLFPRGMLNAHPSLLPLYRGADPVFWMYYHEEKIAGVTVHFVDPGEDTGDIAKQAELSIGFGEPGRDFLKRCAELAATLMLQALEDVAQGTVQRSSQRELRCPFRARKLKRGENPIGWNEWRIERVYHVLRGATNVDLLPRRPFPFSLLRWEPTGFDREVQAGALPRFLRSGGGFYVACSRGRIRLHHRFSLEQAELGLKALLRPLIDRVRQ